MKILSKSLAGSIVYLALMLGIFHSFSLSQACGKSVRKIALEFEAKAKKPKKVSYELFYVAPKGKGPTEFWDEKMTEFVSDFYHGDPKKEKYRFWQTSYDTTEFLPLSKEKAEKYLKSYKKEDFKVVYEAAYNSHQLPQLKGEFAAGKLELKTGETDNTPFIMKVMAKGFETQYLLADFLGGCHGQDKGQIIRMKGKGK